MKHLFPAFIYYFRKIFFSSVIIFAISFNPVFPEDIILRKVRYLRPDILEWSEPVNIMVSGKLIRSLDYKEAGNDPAAQTRFVIPSLCDAFATIGANSLGGQNSLPEIRTALRSFLAHGFTHIQTVADGNWLYVLREEVKKERSSGPEIVLSPRPLLAKSKETNKLNAGNYFISDKGEDFEKEISSLAPNSGKIVHLFYRYNPGEKFNFDARLINSLSKITSGKEKTLSVTAFADRVSILESITAGVLSINHPIPYDLEKNLTKFHYNGLRWSPVFNNYYFLSRQGSSSLKTEFDFISKKSKYFKSNFAPTMEVLFNSKNLSDEELEKAKGEYNSYISFFKEHKELSAKMILSGGSGALYSFPGVSGIQELRIIRSVIGDGKDLLRIPTENTCSYLATGHSGKIKLGKEANLLVLLSDPLKNIDILLEPESVIKEGEYVFPRKTMAKPPGKKRKKHETGRKEK